ncbi:MAG: hypothetical protein FJ096_15405 [Deltaproteobacteria bacterium]|nr:hypothetical protein [Deltaproteobacteria bacterium]
MRYSLLALALSSATWLYATRAASALPEAHGLGSRAASMAGAVGADARDFSAVAYNPAGLAAARGMTLDLGYTANLQRLRTNGLDNDVDDVRGLVAGLVAPGRIAGLPVAFGVALHLPDSGLSFIKSRRQEAPRWELHDTRQQLLFLAAAVAVRPVPWLEAGVGLGYLSATRGRFGLRGAANLAAPFDSQLEHEVDADLTSVRYPIVGVRASKPGWGTVGVSYRGESQLDLALAARLDGTVGIAGLKVPLLYELEARTFSAFSPRTLTASWSFQRVERLHLNVDLSWVGWSAYESPVARIRARLDVTPPPGAPVVLPPSPAPTLPVAPHLRDRVVPRIGVEFRLPFGGEPRMGHAPHALALRAGYAYEATPVPPPRGATTLIDTDRHTVAVGVGLALRRPFDVLPGTLRLDLHGSLGVLQRLTVVKDSPADFVGDFVADGRIVGLGATTEVEF